MWILVLALLVPYGLAGQTQKEQTARFFREREDLHKKAKAAFDAEMGREKTGDCRAAQNTREMNACFGGAVDTSIANYKSYSEALRAMLAQPDPFENGAAPAAGPTGPQSTRAQILGNFDHAETAWAQYRDAFCESDTGLYQGGTIVHVMSYTCQLLLIRNHMREMERTYGEYLSH